MKSALYLVRNQSPADISTASEALARHFSHECGFRLLPWMSRQFAQLLSEGFSQDMLESVIECTSIAPRPSWAYLSAIIRRARYHRAYTLDAFVLMPRDHAEDDQLPY